MVRACRVAAGKCCGGQPGGVAAFAFLDFVPESVPTESPWSRPVGSVGGELRRRKERIDADNLLQIKVARSSWMISSCALAHDAIASVNAQYEQVVCFGDGRRQEQILTIKLLYTPRS